MQSAPAVSFACDDGGVWRAVSATLYGASVAAMLSWALGWMLPDHVFAPLWALGPGLAVAAAVWRLDRRCPTRLTWDTQRWHLHRVGVEPRTGQVNVSMDFGRWVLLRFRPDAGRDTTWLAVGSGAGPAARAALYGAGPLPPDRRAA